MKAKYTNLGDYRGKGLMIGIEIVKNQESHEPSGQITGEIM